MALATGANVLALTIIEAAVRDPSLIRRRDALNALIAEHEADRLYVAKMPNLVDSRQYSG